MRGPTHRLPGLVTSEHRFRVPLDHAAPGAETLQLFAREVVAPAREHDELPWLVFLQGGPGFGAPRPVERKGWLARALEQYRVLLFDQRGTGRSSPVDVPGLGRRAPAEQARVLGHFRADAIVADAEHVRRELLGDQPWTVLGQSYGGFCVTTYLSQAPAGLCGAVLTGGLPPVGRSADEVYRATYERCADRNRRYYARYPDDVERVRQLVDHLARHDVRLPEGDRLNPRRLQQLGLSFGMSDGFESVHYLLEQAWIDDPDGRRVADAFLREFVPALPYASHPIFSLLHEAAYCEGAASRWAAERVRAEHPAFDAAGDGPVFFTGEMIYPWMFEDYAALRPVAQAARLLAEREDWPALYDVAALERNRVPCAAVIYDDDMYVERRFSEETARHIAGLRPWITNRYDHNGLRADGKAVLGRLLDTLAGE